jgi:hypothetical protein
VTIRRALENAAAVAVIGWLTGRALRWLGRR